MNDNFEKIDLNEWVEFGEGATSYSYYNKNDGSIMLKLFKKSMSLPKIENEYKISNEVYKLGLNAPKVYSMVSVNDTYGIIFERLQNKISIASLCAEDKSKIGYCAEQMADFVKVLHSIKCDVNIFTDKGEFFREFIKSINIRKDLLEKMYELIDSTKKTDTCVHGDMTPSNYIISNGKLYMIDFATFGCGNYMYDMGALYWPCKISFLNKFKKELFHMDNESLSQYWDIFIKRYLDTNDNDEINEFNNIARKYSVFTTMLIYVLFPQATKEEYEELIENQLNP